MLNLSENDCLITEIRGKLFQHNNFAFAPFVLGKVESHRIMIYRNCSNSNRTNYSNKILFLFHILQFLTKSFLFLSKSLKVNFLFFLPRISLSLKIPTFVKNSA